MDKVKILLVDDQAKNLLALEAILNEPSYELIKADSGAAALRQLLTPDFALILLDARMPKMDGFETAQLIRARDKTADIPIIFITAEYKSIEYMSRAYSLRAVDYMLKPINQTILKAKVSVLVELYRKTELVKQQAELLRQSESQLEKLVQERTLKLKQANRQLQQEVLERKRAELALEEERATLAQRVAERTTELRGANAELARAARMKDEFLASMSHELRTPLSTILALSEILQEQLNGPLNQMQHDSLQDIEQSGRHLLALINDILDVAKIEAGKVELNIGLVSIEALCRSSLQFIRQQVIKKQLKLSLSLDSSISQVVADPRRIKQILINLLSNAVKFTAQGGSIGLEVVADAEASLLYFRVWDTGIGIAQENLERLFKPFTQLDSRLARQYNGTGLGLALVHRLTQLHGGTVEVESILGKGSSFTVSLPLLEAEDDAPKTLEKQKEAPAQLNPPQAAFPASQGTSLSRILLAEDNEAIIRTLTTYLQSKRYHVTVARNGNEAVARAEEEEPDLILMDIQMPVCNGLEAIRRIRSQDALKSVPIIALTALAMPEDRALCLKAGATQYLTKPVPLKTLLKMIEIELTK